MMLVVTFRELHLYHCCNRTHSKIETDAEFEYGLW